LEGFFNSVIANPIKNNDNDEMKTILAFDRSSRTVDADGRLHVDKSHISKAAINPYYGREIPQWDELGLQPKTIYKLYRDPAELAKAAPTFARLPILKEHIPVTVDSPRPDLVIGAIGSNVEFNSPYLDADLVFWDATAIAGIETGTVRELSCSYRYVADMTPGNVSGEPYDGRMTEIMGNHLALVEVGRAGADVYVSDSNPFTETTEMKRKSTIKAAVLAKDATLSAEQLDNVIDALIGVEDEPEEKPEALPPAVDESPAEKVKSMLSGKVDDATISAICDLIAPPAANDKDPKDDEDKVSKEDVKSAMDAMRQEFRDATEARAAVRPVVGDVIAMDSAAEIYGFALDHLKVDHKGVTGLPALKALLKVATGKAQAAPIVAHDSAGAVSKFPGIARFKTV
jgi:hypothetical protein